MDAQAVLAERGVDDSSSDGVRVSGKIEWRLHEDSTPTAIRMIEQMRSPNLILAFSISPTHCYTVMAYLVVVYLVTAYLVMAYLVMAYLVVPI